MAAGDGRPELPTFQMEVARVFFALPASKGFLLAGGAALLAQRLTARPTEDLDFFASPERGHVSAARDALEAAARQRGWVTERIRDSGTFCRFGKDALITRATQIDAGFDAKVLAGMMAALDRFTDSEIPVPSGSSAAELRAFYTAWRSELAALAGFRQRLADPGTAGQKIRA